jgi:integrase
MFVYQPAYKSKKGELKKVKCFWAEVSDSRNGIKTPARFNTYAIKQRSAENIGEIIQDMLDFIRQGRPYPDLQAKAQDTFDPRLQDKLIECGLLPPKIAPAKLEDTKLVDLLESFKNDIYEASKKKSRVKKKASTKDEQAKTTTARVRKVLNGSGIEKIKDIDSIKINKHIEDRPEGISDQTAHFYSQSIKRFLEWMHKKGYIASMPEINIVPAPDNYGRAFELDEFSSLLETTKSSGDRYGLTGYQRYLLYLVACETGLRRGELNSLTAASIDPENSCVTVKGEHTKNSEPAVQNITPETCQLLAEYAKNKTSNVQLFPIHKRNSAKMIQEDCEAAGIDTGIRKEGEEEHPKGILKFHSLRHTCGSFLSALGAQPREVMEIMRHHDINLCMRRYTHLLTGRKQAAVNRLRQITEKAKSNNAKTA